MSGTDITLLIVSLIIILFIVTNKAFLRTKLKRWMLVVRVIFVLFVVFCITGLIIQKLYERRPKNSLKQVSWGVSFSQKMSEDLGLNWRENYSAILDELHPRGIRLIAYWDLIEPTKGIYNFDDLDWQVEEAKRQNIPIIIAFGQKVPRWPECHYPEWLNVNDKSSRQKNLIKYETQVINHYKNVSNLRYWQIENEPYLIFGKCPKLDKDFYRREINLTRKLDKVHKILLTDGGEYGKWYFQARDGDIFGTTLYRKVYKKYIGSYHPLLTPEYYMFKEDVVKKLTKKTNQQFIISELGMEPWWNKQVYELPIDQQKKLLSVKEFNNIAEYARKTNIDEIYMWGAEWWYYMKTKNNPIYWNQAEKLINSGR